MFLCYIHLAGETDQTVSKKRVLEKVDCRGKARKGLVLEIVNIKWIMERS